MPARSTKSMKGTKNPTGITGMKFQDTDDNIIKSSENLYELIKKSSQSTYSDSVGKKKQNTVEPRR